MINKYTLIEVIFLILLFTQMTINDTEAQGLEDIKLPDGFKIEIYASDIQNARSMVLSPDGILFVGTRKVGNVYAVLDKDKDNKAEHIIKIAQGLNMPNGVDFRKGSLYVAEVNRVLRYDN
ncbi:sorbosone dehydrogenase family protein, partial [Candidatus Poribacteria bacterium]|nr:sorbosone dehydrogenase family protein [Candidatus Poribacteria bacterium]